MSKNKGKNNNSADMKGGSMEVSDTNNMQMQNKSGGGKKGGAQNKSGGQQDCK